MRKYKRISLLPLLTVWCLIASSLLLNPRYTSASETEVTIPHIIDEAGLLSTSELDDLGEKCITYGDDASIGIFILTHEDSSAVDGEVYIENFYDSSLKGQYTDSVILLVDMANRDVVLEGYGTAETYIHSQRGDVIISDITPYLSDGDYVTAFEMFIEEANSYMKDTSDPNYSRDYTPAPEDGSSTTKDSILTNVFFQLLVSLGIGAITVGIMAYNAGGKMTVSGNTYIDQGHSGLIGRRDDYIRTTVTRVRKPKENSSSGGFHGGISGGGSSHSTSRGSF